MIHLKRYLIILFIGLSQQICYSQYSISGSLKDNDSQRISYATIRLMQTDSTFVAGTITDTLGYYQFKNIHPNNYLLAFSNIGYQSKIIPITISNINVQVPPVILKNDNIMLNEVVVKGSSFIRKEDHILVIPDKQQVKHANTGYDLLYNLMIPSLDINKQTGKVTTFGGTVSLYINGEKAEYRDIQSLRPRDIQNIEYYDVPMGKYAKDIAAINYITKQYQSGGYIALDGKQNIGYLGGDYNVATKLSYKNTSFSVWGGYNIKEYNGTQNNKYETIYFPNYIVNRNGTTENATIRNNQQYTQFKISNTNQKHNLSAQMSLVANNTPKERNEDNLEYSGHYVHSERATVQKVSKSLQPSIKLYGDFKLSKTQTIDFTLQGSYTQNDYKRNYMEGNHFMLTNVDEDMYSLKFNCNYNIQLKHKNSLGFNLSHAHKITSSSYTGDYYSWQHLWSGESIAFMTYVHKLKKLMVIIRPGISILNYKLHDNELQKHYTLRFNTMIIHPINKTQQIRYYVNIGNITPDISFINNIDQNIDLFQVVRGNPYLDNTKLYNIGINYNNQWNKLNFQTSVDYMGYINNTCYNYYFENEKLINSFRSNDDAHTLSIRLGATYRFSDKLRAKVSTQYMFQKATGESQITDNSFSGKLDLNYFWKDFSLNLYGSAETSQANIWTFIHKRVPMTYGAVLSWSHKGWYTEIGTNNPFTKHSHYKEYVNLDIYQYNQVQTSRINQQTGYIKVAYTLDFGRKTTREKNDVDRKINSAIIKSY